MQLFNRISTRLTDDDLKRLEARARRENTDRSKISRLAIVKFLAEDDNQAA
jgi:metal-responsive CopG/Arc/MetJ family transcriptional regulator